MKYHALFVIFDKLQQNLNCCLLQIIGGALRVKFSSNKMTLDQICFFPDRLTSAWPIRAVKALAFQAWVNDPLGPSSC